MFLNKNLLSFFSRWLNYSISELRNALEILVKKGISELKKTYIEFEYVGSEFCYCNSNVFSTIGKTQWANNV